MEDIGEVAQRRVGPQKKLGGPVGRRYLDSAMKMWTRLAMPKLQALPVGNANEDQEEETLPMLQRGDTVDAKVEGWIRYYSGEVENVNRDGSIDVRFHDGDLEEHIPRKHVKLN